MRSPPELCFSIFTICSTQIEEKTYFAHKSQTFQTIDQLKLLLPREIGHTVLIFSIGWIRRRQGLQNKCTKWLDMLLSALFEKYARLIFVLLHQLDD
jgi:hypothetical protein